MVTWAHKKRRRGPLRSRWARDEACDRPKLRPAGRRETFPFAEIQFDSREHMLLRAKNTFTNVKIYKTIQTFKCSFSNVICKFLW